MATEPLLGYELLTMGGGQLMALTLQMAVQCKAQNLLRNCQTNGWMDEWWYSSRTMWFFAYPIYLFNSIYFFFDFDAFSQQPCSPGFNSQDSTTAESCCQILSSLTKARKQTCGNGTSIVTMDWRNVRRRKKAALTLTLQRLILNYQTVSRFSLS